MAPLTAKTCRAVRPSAGAAPCAVLNTAAKSKATTVVGAYTTPARGAAMVKTRPGKAADHKASAASEWSPAKGANASSPKPTAWGTVTAAADHAAPAADARGAWGSAVAPTPVAVACSDTGPEAIRAAVAEVARWTGGVAEEWRPAPVAAAATGAGGAIPSCVGGARGVGVRMANERWEPART